MTAASARVQRSPDTVQKSGSSRAGRVQRAVSDLAMRTGARLGLGGPAQASMQVSRPGDPLERQADATADRVMRMPTKAASEPECIPCAQNPRAVQRAAAGPEAPAQRASVGPEAPAQREAAAPEPPIMRAAVIPQPPIQRAASTSDNPPPVPTRMAQMIRSPGPGKPLPPEVREQIEPGIGADLTGVRVHEGPAAATAAVSIQAKAFTHGPNIFLGPLESSRDVRLMAHESTHVVQQGAAGVQRSADEQAVQRIEDQGIQRAADEQAVQRVEDHGIQRAADEQLQRDCAPCEDTAVQRTAEPAIQRSFWSDVTGVAGAVWDATGGQLLDAAGNVLEMGADLFWKIAQEVLPESILTIINEIRAQGIVGFLAAQLRTVFNAVFGGLKGDGSSLGALVQAFDDVLAAAPAIVEALKSGDCEPLFAAVSQLGDALGKIAGEAWDAIVEFFRPIGEFFSDLWASFGAPVVDWLTKFAGDTWTWIKDLGQQLWDFTQPVRDALAAAWDWLKGVIGIGGGEDGQGGIIGWVTEKAGEAWDGIMEVIQPVVGPLQSMVEKVVSVLPLSAIFSLRDTISGWLGGVQGMVGNLQQPQGAVSNQDTLRDEILPAVKAAILSLRDGLTGTGAWIAGEIGGLVGTVTGFLDSLRANPVLGLAAGLFDWISSAVSGLGAWAQSTVGSLFGFLGDGLVKLSELVEPILDTLRKVVSVVGDVVGELPGLVLGPFWRLIPACIREPIKNFIINHILKNIPIINKFLEIPDIWSKIQDLVLDFLKRVFVNGDLTGAVMVVIRFVLEAVGVDVDMLLGVIAKGAAAIQDIIMDPVSFLGNLFSAMKLGLDQFLGNIGQHLINGLLSWMLGPLADLGIRIPKELSLASVLDLVLQILGITGAKLRQKAEKLIGKKAVDVLEKAWTFISALIEGGPAKLWEEIKNQLSGLWDSVIGGITSWITTEVVEAGILWIAKLSNPVGAVIEAIRQIYNIVSFVVGQANKIIAFADAVVSSLGQIVHGEIAGAANWIEQALGRTVPLVIEFLAGLVGISSPAPQIRGIVEKIQGTVDLALDWLVEKAKAIGQGLLSALGLGSKKDDDQEALPDAEVQTQFSMGPEGHTLTARVKGGEVDVWMASGEETRIALMLYGAIDEVEHGEFPEPDRSEVLKRLKAAKKDSDRNKILDEWQNRDPRSKGYGPRDFPIYLSLRLAQIVGDLQPLAGFGITNLDSFFSAPKDKRYLPAGYDVRAKLYERGSGWGSTRTSVFQQESTRIRQDVQAANALLTTDKAAAERAWEQLRKADEIPSAATLGKFTSADVDKTKYHVDHKDALAVHWMTVGFNEKGDEGRQGITVRPGNLRLITAEANLRKGAKTEDGDRGTYTNFVGPDFESEHAPGGKNAKTIDGQPFTDAAGTPIR